MLSRGNPGERLFGGSMPPDRGKLGTPNAKKIPQTLAL